MQKVLAKAIGAEGKFTHRKAGIATCCGSDKNTLPVHGVRPGVPATA